MPHFDSQITFYYTDKLSRTAEWYEQVLGLELAIDQGVCRIYRVAGQGFLGFCERAVVGLNHDDIILTFITDEVDEWYERLRQFDAIVMGEPEVNEKFEIYHFFARDPNGYRIEIQKFLSDNDHKICHEVS